MLDCVRASGRSWHILMGSITTYLCVVLGCTYVRIAKNYKKKSHRHSSFLTLFVGNLETVVKLKRSMLMLYIYPGMFSRIVKTLSNGFSVL